MNKKDDKIKDRSENLNANQELNTDTLNLEAVKISAEEELSGDRRNPHREQQSRKDDEFEEDQVEE